MADADKPLKVSIGFRGGQALQTRVKPDEFARLQAALGAAGGWFQLASETGTIHFDPERIDFVAIEDSEHRVGF